MDDDVLAAYRWNAPLTEEERAVIEHNQADFENLGLAFIQHQGKEIIGVRVKLIDNKPCQK